MRPLHAVLLVSAVCLLAVAVVVLREGPGPAAQPRAAPMRTTAPPPSPSPSPRPEPVRGDATVVVGSTDAGPLVYNDRPAPPPDQPAIDAAVDAVVAWLDAHLTDLQEGGEGLLADVAVPGLVDSAGPAALRAVTTGLAGPDRTVRTALYHVVVAEEGGPVWLRVTALVETEDGTVSATGYVFQPGQPLQLLAAGPDPQP